MVNIDEYTSKCIEEYTKNTNKIFENALRLNAIPPIKGLITKEKIKWRCVKIVEQRINGKIEKWLEQRGKII